MIVQLRHTGVSRIEKVTPRSEIKIKRGLISYHVKEQETKMIPNVSSTFHLTDTDYNKWTPSALTTTKDILPIVSNMDHPFN